jgi:hypothetical protein
MPDKKTIGVAGNNRITGIDNGEYLSKLSGATGRNVFDRMRRSDPQVGAVLRAIMLPIRQAKFYVDPVSDTGEDKDIAEVVEKNLLTGMSITWDDFLRHALLSLIYGISVLEKIWDVRDGKVYLAKLDPRLPTSLLDTNQWTFDPVDHSLKEITQRGADGQVYKLPIEKLLVFSCDKEGDNWEGISILRTAYKPWCIKDDLEKINVINHDRNGVGIPVAQMPESCKPTSPEWEATADALEELTANEKAYLMVPFGASVEILGADGKATDTLESIKYYDEAISRAVLAQFINLGTSASGSRALGDSLIDVFMTAEQAYAQYICDVINRYLIQEYVNYNWDVKEYPVLKVHQIKKIDPTVIKSLLESKAITPDFTLENHIRDEYNLPEKKEEDLPVVPDPLKPFVPGQEVQPGSEPAQVQQQPDLKTQKDAASMPKEVKASTKRTAAEDFPYCDFIGMEMRLNDAETKYTQRMLQIMESQRASIVDQLIAGKEIHQVMVPRKKEMFELMMDAYREQHSAGAADVRKEMEKQKGVALANRAKLATRNSQTQYAKYANLQVTGATNKMLTTIATEEIDHIGEGLDDVGMKSVLDDTKLSTSTWESMISGAINNGWNNGRDDEAATLADEIDYCIYTSVMDTNTCYRCELKDGQEHQFGDAEFETPNPSCAGGDWCRCMTVYVFKSEGMTEEDYAKNVKLGGPGR